MPRAAILTSVPVEYQAVRAHLTNPQEEIHPQGTIYERGKFAANGQTWDVWIAEMGEGNVDAAVETERAISHLQPDILFYVGMAVGISENVDIGDVVVATQIYRYKLGDEKKRFVSGSPLQSTHALVQRARVEIRKTNYRERALAKSGSSSLTGSWRILLSPIITTDEVIASEQSEIFQFLRTNYADAIALDQTGSGILSAASTYPKIKAMVIHGISDLIKGKDDDSVDNERASALKKSSKPEASEHASSFAFEILAKFQIEQPRPENTALSPVVLQSADENGILAYLELRDVGPTNQLVFEPSERLNVITGDNGLGKTFILECAWWALTGQWAGFPAYPDRNSTTRNPEIRFQIAGESQPELKLEPISVFYDRNNQIWRSPPKRPTLPGLIIYARVDGSFALWDPAKQYWSSQQESGSNRIVPRPFVFDTSQIWNGYKDQNGSAYINGLIQDWIQWQNKSDRTAFKLLEKVLSRLSPPEQSDLGLLKPGEPVRLPYDAREIPTIEHLYGSVPIVHASAGVKRILTLAYLMVWIWEEHKIQSSLIRKEPQKRLVILLDELESHLHPQWQRVILPALLEVGTDLDADLQVQLIVATHSPLVLASVEPDFDAQRDKLFRLELEKSDRTGNTINLEELPFIKQGVVNAWLTSDVFKLRHPRSLAAEKAIEAAKSLQLQDSPSQEDVEKVSRELLKHLSEDDRFWPRWVYFAEQYGVEL
ncbi:MAG: AAA family ATPase [Cyanobacteria bacterium P01_E01_bin.42]